MTMVLLREVPSASPVHRLWAGTKIIAVFLINLVVMLLPSWPVLGMIVAFLIVIGLVARLPLGTLPRLPWQFWALLGVGGLLNVPAGGDAILHYVLTMVFALIMVVTSFL